MTSIRITGRPMLALRASEAVLRKYLEDDAAFWTHIELNTRKIQDRDVMPHQETSFDGLIWSPKANRYAMLAITTIGKLWHGSFVLYGATVNDKDENPRPPAGYLLTHDDITDLVVSKEKFPNGSLPGIASPGYELESLFPQFM